MKHIKNKVKEILSKVLNVEISKIGNNDHINNYGGFQSILAVQLISKFESTFNVKLTLDELNDTPAGLSEKINERMDTSNKVKELLSHTLGIEASKIENDVHINNYGTMQSILAVQLISKIDSTFNVKLTPKDLNDTPVGLTKKINDKLEEPTNKVKTMISQVLGVEKSKVGDHDHISNDLGMQSILAVQLNSKIESEFKVKLTPQELNDTPHEISKKITDKLGETTNKVKEIVSQLSGVKKSKIGNGDNITLLGMQSILAVQLISKIESTFNVKLSPTDLNDTPNGLSQKINHNVYTNNKVNELLKQVSDSEIDHHSIILGSMQSILAVQLLSKIESTFNVKLSFNDLNVTPIGLSNKINQHLNTTNKVNEILSQVSDSNIDHHQIILGTMQSILAVQLISKLESAFNVKLTPTDLNDTPVGLSKKINDNLETTKKVTDIISQLTGTEKQTIGNNDQISKWGGFQSILAVQLISKIGRTFNVQLDPLEENDTPNTLTKKINDKLGETVYKVKDLLSQVTGVDKSTFNNNEHISKWGGFQSILAVQLISKIGSTFNVKLTPEDLNDTPSGLAQKINEKLDDTRNKVKGLLRELSNYGPDNIGLDHDVSKLGFTSILAVEFINKVNTTFNASLKIGDFKGDVNTISETINKKLMGN